jgi:hypothetical protein
MASIIPGYEYDIFISHRQKDNKHDGWVTEFVKNLKGERELIFKTYQDQKFLQLFSKTSSIKSLLPSILSKKPLR